MTKITEDHEFMTNFSDLCEMPVFEIEDCLCIGDSDNASAVRAGFGEDKTGFEAFVNHAHIADLGSLGASALSMDLVRRLAAIVVHCWGLSLLPLLKGRSVLFFAGGTSVDDFTVRFHVDRPESSWLDLSDAPFLTREAVNVWRLDLGGLSCLHSSW